MAAQEPSERDSTRRLAGKLAHTEVCNWRAGDIASFSAGKLTMQPYSQ